MTTFELVSLALGSSVVAALLTNGFSALRDWTKERKEADFSALYLALALEDYAGVCGAIAADAWNYESSSGEIGKARSNVKAVPDFPNMINWRALGLKTTSDVMSFRVEVDSVRSMLSAQWEVDSDASHEEAPEYAVELGVQAMRLAERLRAQRGLPGLSERWSTRVWLDEKMEMVRASRSKRAAGGVLIDGI